MASKTNSSINGQNYYRIRKVIGHKDGKPVTKNFYGSSKTDAEKKYLSYMREKDKGQTEIDISTLHDRSIEYIETTLRLSQKYSSGTKIRYESAYKVHVENSWLDRMPVAEIKALDVQRFYAELDVSISTLKQVNRYMHALYKWMAMHDYAADIIDAVNLPIKKDTKKSETIQVWSDEDWNRLTSQNLSRRHDLMIKMLCYSGMRIGEVLALKYGDIRDGVIHVTRQYSVGEIKGTKYKSDRDIPMHDKVTQALEVHKQWHKQEMKENGYKTDYIFTTKSGNLYDYQNLARAFNRIYKKHGITPMHFHVYRATFCTKLCEKGVPLEVASKLLGHKSMEVTARHYALVRSEAKRNAVSLLD